MDGIFVDVYCPGYKTFYDTLTSMSWVESSQLLCLSSLFSHSTSTAEQVANWHSSVILPWGRTCLVMTAPSSGHQQRQTDSQGSDMPACHPYYSPAASSFATAARAPQVQTKAVPALIHKRAVSLLAERQRVFILFTSS